MSLEAQLSTEVSSLSLVAVLLIPLVCHVHLHQYSWFSRIFSAVANQYRKSASLLKRSVSIITISWPNKLVNIAFSECVLHPCRVGPEYSNNRVILRPNVEINCYDIFMLHIFWCMWNAQVIAQSQGWFCCLPLLSRPTRRLDGGLLVRADAEKKNQVSHGDWIDCNWVFTSTTDRTEGKYNFGDVMGWRNSKKIK